MKKRLLVLGMVIVCALGLTACGPAKEGLDQDATDQAIEVSDMYIEQVGQIVEAGNISQVINANEELAPIFENWEKGMADLGSISETVSHTVKPDGKKMIVNTLVTGTLLDPNGAARTADIELIYNTKTFELESLSVNVKYTMAELMTKAGLNTLIGMATVFTILILIMIVISCFKIINKIETSIADKKKKATETDKAVDNTIAQIIENEELAEEDDNEIIAVISAAIAAYEAETGTVSADGVVIRSIRKVNKSKWQNA